MAVIYEISFRKSGNWSRYIIFELSDLGSHKRVQTRSFDKWSKCGGNLKILLIRVTHMASCNLRNFEGSVLRFRKSQITSRNLTDFVNYKKRLWLIVRKSWVILRNLTVFINYRKLFHTLLKRQKNKGFLASSGYIEMEHWVTQPAFICSKLTMETLEQGVKYVQS